MRPALSFDHTHQAVSASVEAVARDQSRDNVLFSTGAGKFAMVHLTWRVETAPSWPWTSLYDDYDSWKAEKDADFDEFDDN